MRAHHEAGRGAGSSHPSVFSNRYDQLLRSVVTGDVVPTAGQAGSSKSKSSAGFGIQSFAAPSAGANSSSASTGKKSSSGTLTVTPESFAAETVAKLGEAQLKLEQHVDDLLELFDQPHVIGNESVPPVLKKAWPSISR